jgi:hypothetical protein
MFNKVPLAAATLLAAASLAQAGVITSNIGASLFPSGSFLGSGTFVTAVAGQPAPFNGFIGGDNTSNFSATWVFNYSIPATDTITAASIQIGIFDHDSAGAGDQVASFTLNTSNDLTVPLNTLFNASGGQTVSTPGVGTQSEYDIYTLTLPSSVFASLAGGTATFSLTLQNGVGVLGATPFNGAGMDFSTLSITTQSSTPPPPQVPEPSTAALMAIGLSAVAVAGYRRVSRR